MANLNALYNLTFYRRQKDWQLGNEKSKSSRKAATEIKNRLYETYIVDAEPPEATEEVEEQPELCEAFLDLGTKEESADISVDLVDGADWSTEADAALHKDFNSGQMSHWSSLDSEVFMRGAAAAPHSSERDLNSTFRSSSPGGFQSLVSRQERVPRRLLHLDWAEKMYQKHNNSTRSLEQSSSSEFHTDKDSSFIRGSFRDLEGFEGGRRRVIIRAGRPYWVFG